MKKFDFSKKHNISAICFVVVMVITFVLCYSFPVVHAEENTGTLSSYYTVNGVYSKTEGKTYTQSTYPSYIYTNQFFEYGPFSDDNMDYADDILDVFKSDYDFQTDLGNTSLGSVGLYFFTLSGSDELRFCFNTTCLVRGNWSKNPPEYYEVQFNQSSSYKLYKIVDGVVSYDGTLANSSSIKALPVTNIVTATGPIYVHGQNGMDVNYLTANGINSNTSGGCGLSRSYANEDASNNLYLEESDFIFTHQTYYAPYSSSINTGSAVPVGTITFKGQPNDYQIEHANDFYVQLYFNFDYDVDYKNQTGNDIMDFKKTSNLLDNQKNLFYFFATPTNGPSYKMSLTNFINSGNSFSVTISDVFGDLEGGTGRTLSGVLNQSKEVTEISYNSFKLTCNAFIIGNGLASQGKYTEWYNFNSKKGFTTDDSLNTNPNPYTPNPNTQADDDPDSSNVKPTPNVPGPGGTDGTNGGGNSSSSSQSNPNIVITNNPTFNNNSSASATANGNGGGMIPTLLSYLSNGQQASVETINSVANTNGWLNVVKDVYSFVPVTLWTSLIHYFTIAITILIVGFILSIVIKFIT